MAETSTVDTIRENLRLQQVYNVLIRYSLDALVQPIWRCR